jgi:PAS domain S-box-containing protein
MEVPSTSSLAHAMDGARARYDALLELSPDGIWILDRHGHIDEVNGLMARMLDRDVAELRGRAVYEFLPADVADDTRRRLAAMAPGRRGTQWQEFRLKRRDGSLVEVEASGVAIGHGETLRAVIVARPVAQRKQIESALDASRQRLRSVFDALAEGVVVQDVAGRILECNPAACRILGLDVDQLAGRTSIDPRWRAVHEDGSPFPGETHPAMRTLRTGQASRGDIMGVHKPDGTLCWISINSEPLLDAKQAVAGVVTSFSDISERRVRERELENERHLNRQIIETSPFGISIYDHDGNCVAANPAMARDLGATLPQVLAQNYHRIDSWKRSGLHELALRALQTDVPLTIAGPMLTSFGRQAWLETTCRALDLAGRRGLMVVTRDLTDAKLAEQALEQSEIKYSSLVQQASDGIFIAAADGRCTEVNDAGCRMLGYTRDEILAMRIDDVVEADEQQAGLLEHERLRSGEPLLTERRMRRKDGSALLAEISGRLLPDGQFLGLVRDIGPRKATEEALRAKAVAERSNRAKSEFVSHISHELRTPLNAILGFSELLQLDAQHPLDAIQSGKLEHIRNAGRHLLTLIDDLLDLSRIEAGVLKLKLEDIDLHEVVRHALDDLRAGAEHGGVRLVLEVSMDPVPLVRGDRTRLRQVVVNLLSNAIKYNRAGGKVAVRVAPLGERLRLSVSDDGPGMTPAQQRNLFQPFNRLGREGSRVEGTGIGLVITRSLVEMMGGRLSVRSDAGRGSEFMVDLVVAQPAAAQAGAAAAIEPPVATRSDVRGRVLYIEDDEVNRVLMQAYLGLRPAVDLMLAVDGRSGIDAALGGAPDLVLLDMSLSDMDGLDVLRALRSHPRGRRLPCIAISADAMPEDIAAARAAGIDGYLTKPVPIAQLLAVVDTVLTSRQTP